MTLKELINVTDKNTLFCVCDNMGPYNDVVKLSEIPLVCLMYDLDRKVERIYVDTEDNSLTVILENLKEADFSDED